MRRLAPIVVLITSALLCGCASQAEWNASAPSPAVVTAMSPDVAMKAACQRQRTKGTMTDAWAVYCGRNGY